MLVHMGVRTLPLCMLIKEGKTREVFHKRSKLFGHSIFREVYFNMLGIIRYTWHSDNNTLWETFFVFT